MNLFQILQMENVLRLMTTQTEKYNPYPAYRSSDVEWLGEIPAHWEVKRLKTFANVQLSNVDN